MTCLFLEPGKEFRTCGFGRVHIRAVGTTKGSSRDFLEPNNDI
jgi:hypothetical protein